MHRLVWVSVALAAMVVPGRPAPVFAGDDLLRPLFVRTAGDAGQAYAVGRNYLEQQGRGLVPLLQEKALADNYRQRDLARALRLRIETPQLAAALLRGLEAWDARLRLDQPGMARVELGQAAEGYAASKTNPPVPPEGVTYDRAAGPLLIDYLWATADSGDNREEAAGLRALAILAHLADLETAPALVDLLGHRVGKQTSATEDALVKLGPAAVVPLRRALANAPTKDVQEPNIVRERVWRGVAQSGAVVRVLARLGDRDSVPRMVALLQDSHIPAQQTELAKALAALRDPRGVPAVFGLALEACRGSLHSKPREVARYGDIREALLQFGSAAREYLAGQRVANTLGARVLAAGVLLEIENPQAAAQFYEALGRTLPDTNLRWLDQLEKPARKPAETSAAQVLPAEKFAAAGRAGYWSEWFAYRGHDWMSFDGLSDEAFAAVADVLAEHTWWLGRGPELERLARMKRPDSAFDVLLEIAAESRKPQHALRAVRALGLWGGRRAVKELCNLAATPTQAPPEMLAEAALLVGDPEATTILDAVQATAQTATGRSAAAWREAARVAAELTPAVRSDRQALRQLLQHAKPEIRSTAAHQLLRQEDLSGMGVLLDEVARPQGGAAMDTRQAIIARGKPGLDALRPYANELAGSPRRVMAEAVIVRITDATLAAKFDRAIAYRSRGFSTRVGPRTDDYRITGRQIAAEVGKAAAPLLEAEVLAPSQGGNGEVAAFALAVFGQKSSLVLLAAVLRDLKREERSRGLIAHAVRDFGDQGIAAIKDIPAPDPDRPQFQGRAGRFRGATEALAGADPKAAAENVIKGLTALAAESAKKEPGWTDRVRGFFRLAEQVEDPAIIAPILALLQQRPTELEPYAFRALSRFEDPRLTEPALHALLAPEDDSVQWRSDPLLTLTRQLKEQTAARLVKEWKDSPDAAWRARALEAMARLVDDPAIWPVIYAKGEQPDPRTAAACKISFDAAIEPLLAALEDPDADIQYAAARSLPMVRGWLSLKTDDRPVRRLLAWLPKAHGIPGETVEFLIWTHHEAVKPALLAAFRQRGRKDRTLLTAFQRAGWPEAVAEIYAALQQGVADGRSADVRAQIHALDSLPPEGRRRLHDVLRDRNMPLHVRLDAACVLSGQGIYPLGRECVPAYGDTLALRDEIERAGGDDPRLKAIFVQNVARDDTVAKRRHAIQMLTLAAARLDRHRGYRLLMQLLPTLDDGEFRQQVAFLLRAMQEQPARPR